MCEHLSPNCFRRKGGARSHTSLCCPSRGMRSQGEAPRGAEPVQCRCGAVPSPLQALAAWLAPDSPLSSEPGKRGVCAIYVMPGEGPHPSTCRGHLSRSHLDPQAGTVALIPWVSHASPAQCQSPGDTHQPPILGRRTDGWSSTLGTPLWKEPLISRSLVGGPGAPEVLALITWGTQGIVVQQGLCDEPRTPGP